MNDRINIEYDQATPPEQRGVDKYEELDPENDALTLRVAYGGRMIALVGKAGDTAPEGQINGEPIVWRFEPFQGDDPEGDGDWLSTPIEDGEHEITVNDWTGKVRLKKNY